MDKCTVCGNKLSFLFTSSYCNHCERNEHNDRLTWRKAESGDFEYMLLLEGETIPEDAFLLSAGGWIYLYKDGQKLDPHKDAKCLHDRAEFMILMQSAKKTLKQLNGQLSEKNSKAYSRPDICKAPIDWNGVVPSVGGKIFALMVVRPCSSETLREVAKRTSFYFKSHK